MSDQKEAEASYSLSEIRKDGTRGKGLKSSKYKGVRLRDGRSSVDMRSKWGILTLKVESEEEGAMFSDLAKLYGRGKDITKGLNFDKRWLLDFITKNPRHLKDAGCQQAQVKDELLPLAKVALEEWIGGSDIGQGTETTHRRGAAAIRPDTHAVGPHQRAGGHPSSTIPLEQIEQLIGKMKEEIISLRKDKENLTEKVRASREEILSLRDANSLLKTHQREVLGLNLSLWAGINEKDSEIAYLKDQAAHKPIAILMAAIDAKNDGMTRLKDELAAAYKANAQLKAERAFSHYREDSDAVLCPVKDNLSANIEVYEGTSEVLAMHLNPNSRDALYAILPTLEDDDMIDAWFVGDLSEAVGQGALTAD